MKKQVLIFLIILVFIGKLSYSQTTLESVTQTLNGKKWESRNILNKTYPLNSTSKEKFLKGKSKETIKLDIPEGTYYLWFRVTVLDIKSSYQFSEDESYFNSVFIKKGTANNYFPTLKTLNFYIFDFSGDAESFKNNQLFANCYFKINAISFSDNIKIKGTNYWIGLGNPNTLDGIKVILEVVAQGYY